MCVCVCVHLCSSMFDVRGEREINGVSADGFVPEDYDDGLSHDRDPH